MMNTKSFHLKWNNHLQNLQSLFENLYNEQSLVDVTISCSDGLLYGHKLLLSACSPYFEQVFKGNPCKHPVLILKGINRHDMHILLEYMYTGSVDVGEEDLETLLDIATELQIKGLVQKSEETNLYSSNKITKHDKTHIHNNLKSTSPVPQPHSEDLKWQAELVAKPTSTKSKDNNNFHQIPAVKLQGDDSQIMPLYQDSEIKLEPPYLNNENIEGTTQEDEYQEHTEEELNECSGTEFLEESSENMEVNFSFQEPKAAENDEVPYFCHICTRAFQNKNSYQRHMTTHAGVKPHHCTFCDQSFLRLSHLQRHIRVHTGERPYSCGQCPKQFARSDKLRQHYIIQHNSSGAKLSKPRGRPRKNPEFYPPTSLPSPSSPSVSTMYSVSINPVSINIG